MTSKFKSPNNHKAGPPITIVGEGHDEWGKRYFKFAVTGNGQDIPPFSSDSIIKDPTNLFQELANAGANTFTPAVRSHLLNQLPDGMPEKPCFRVVTRLGWTRESFLYPNETVGNSKQRLEPVFRELDGQMLAKYRCNGTLKEWQDKIGRFCERNSRLMFAVSLAFTGPILRLVSGPRSGGFQITGLGETGKTLTAMVAGSVWGCHRSPERQEKGFAESWHTTAGKVEITALAHNETLLILDETKRAGKTGQLRGQAVIDMTFTLAENTERERLNQGPIRAWRLYFLSTSNVTLPELGKMANVEVEAAELGRLPDIPCPAAGHGIYEDIHGYADGAALTDLLKGRCRKFFGTPSRIFVRKLAAERSTKPKPLKRFLRARRMVYLKRLAAIAKSQKLRPLNRATGRFATVYAAGCLAIQYGVFHWSRKELLKAVLSCQLDGLRLTAASVPKFEPTPEILKERLVVYIRDNRSRFADLNDQRPQLGATQEDIPGYTATHKGTDWFYLTKPQVEQIIGDGPNAQQALRQLIDDKLIAQPKRGYVVQRSIFKGGRGNQNFRWVVAFRSAFVEGA